MAAQTIVITDLDGSLLDHHDYSWHAARQALELIAARHIPLILCSSKTVAEIDVLRKALGITAPFVIENGAAIYLPDKMAGHFHVEALGVPRSNLLGRLDAIRMKEGFRFRGFHDMTVTDIAELTGLDHEDAFRASLREFTEPLLWEDTSENLVLFESLLKKAWLEMVAGGRFIHVSSGCDKGRALSWLRHYFERQVFKSPVRVIALGDSDNDVAMLEKADLPVLVKSPVRDFPVVFHHNVYRTSGIGPAGWNEAILAILNKDRS